jgi:hypothetical protein
VARVGAFGWLEMVCAVYERLAERREVVWFGVVNLNLSLAVKRRPC